MDDFFMIHRAKPDAAAHVEAVRGALRDGRLHLKSFAGLASVGEDVVMRWMEDRPIQDSFHIRLWSAAVTSPVPGWPTPRSAMEAVPNEGGVVRDSMAVPRPKAGKEWQSIRDLRLQRQTEAWESILNAADVLLALGALNLQQWQRLFDAGGPVEGAWRMAMQPHDIAVVLYLSLSPGAPRSHVASMLRLSADDVEASLARLQHVGLLRLEIGRGLAVAPTMLLAFLSHGIRMTFPAVLGERVRGLGTAYVRALRDELPVDEEYAVWPAANWADEGRALYPLLPAAAEIADRQPTLYALLAAVDAIRLGRPRDALVARAYLARKIQRSAQQTSDWTRSGAASHEEESDAGFQGQLHQLWILSRRLEEQRDAQSVTEFLATPQQILSGPHGTPVSPNEAVLTGDLDRLLLLLEWVTTAPDGRAPERVAEGADPRNGQDGATVRERVFHAAVACFGSQEKACQWLATPQRALAGGIPFRLLDTDEGALQVLQLIGRIEHGVVG